MCEFCGDDEDGVKGREHAAEVAKMLDRMAADYRAIASKSLKPHSDEIKPTQRLAMRVLREMTDWL